MASCARSLGDEECLVTEDRASTGIVTRLDDAFEARLERVFEHGQDVVWCMLTEPQEFRQWLVPGSIELRPNGAVHIDFADSGVMIDSTVLQFDPPRLLEYSWSSRDEPQRPLCWELDAVREERD
jgi:uncharacterized protein YndB with AHSA1/START domain